MNEAYPLKLLIAPPSAQNRATVFFRLVLAIPHLIILGFIQAALRVVSVIAWFLAGFNRWATRVNGYFYLLTDAYPPFSME